MAFVAQAHLAEGKFQNLKSTLHKIKPLNFRFGTCRPSVFKRVGQYFEPVKTFITKKD